MTSDATKTSVELPLDYYHQNFCQVLSVVQQRYGDLLSEYELGFLQKFYSASKNAQCLYVRLSGRSKSLFRLSKIQYSEIPNLSHAAIELDNLELISLSADLEIEEMLPLFTKPELIELLGISNGSKFKRSDLDAYILEQRSILTLTRLKNADTIVAVLQEEHLPTFRLCFFGNLYQDLTEFVLRDLAVYRFESYSLDTTSRQFESRKQLEQHLRFYACSMLCDETVAEGSESIVALSKALPTPLAHDYSLIRRVSRLRNRLARDLERQQHDELALNLYEKSNYPPSRERRARIYMATGKIEQSFSLCHEILQAPVDEAEAVFAQQFSQRHAKRHNKPWDPIVTTVPEVRHLELEKDRSVELDTANHLARDGTCFYVENSLFSSVLGLAIWPAIFAPVQGAFSHPFQHRPDDFYDADFKARRKDYIDDALMLQRNEPTIFKQKLLKTYTTKQGTANPLVHWQAIDETLLKKALEQIPVAHWQLVFERLLADLRNNRNGLPDLIYFPDDGGYELVEVKGPGDRLQNNQKRWMQFFHSHGIPHWVAQVSWKVEPENV